MKLADSKTDRACHVEPGDWADVECFCALAKDHTYWHWCRTCHQVWDNKGKLMGIYDPVDDHG